MSDRNESIAKMWESALRENPNDKSGPFEVPKTFDGKTAYEVLDLCPECPIQMPHSRSMTSARIDYRSVAPGIVNWYNSTYQNK